MQISADLSLRASADSRSLPWLPFPLPGVDRCMLDRKTGHLI